MRFFKFLFGISRRTVILAVIFGILSGAGSTALLALIGSTLTQGKFTSPMLMWSFIGLCVLMPLSKFIADYSLVRLGQETIFQMRVKLSQQILAAPLRQLEEIGSHRLLATLAEDLSAIISALLFIPSLCINTAIVLGCLVYLAWLSPLVFGVLLCFLVLGVGSYQLPMMRGMLYQRVAREHADYLYKNFRALTEGTKELKLHSLRRKAFLSEHLEVAAGGLRNNNIKAQSFFIGARSWGQTLFFVFIGTLLLLSPSLRGINFGVVIACTVTVLYMMTPLELILDSVSNLSRASVALDKVETLGLALPTRGLLTEGEQPLPAAPASWRLLEMVGVTHAYHRELEDSSFTLGPIDLTFIPGELVFLVGGNGSGKTTLVKLLTGLYKPERGELRLDGRAVTDELLESYRQNFSVIFSDFYLFDNLLGVEVSELDDKARYYLNKLQLDHKVQVKDGRLSTTSLSQGQRKRLALLVAFLEDRPIYVFDEWAADQDPLFKEIFYCHLLPELKSRGKTVIVISHDDRYYFVADRVIKLVNGTLDESAQGFDMQVAPLSGYVSGGD